jgi:hypothetical protein
VLAACSDLLAPLAAKISERNAAAAHLHVDETRWQVYAAVEGKHSHRWWLWVFAAPRGAVSYRLRSGQGWEEVSLDLMAYSGPKGRREENSMPGNRQPCPGVRGGVPGDPRETVKAGLP